MTAPVSLLPLLSRVTGLPFAQKVPGLAAIQPDAAPALSMAAPPSSIAQSPLGRVQNIRDFGTRMTNNMYTPPSATGTTSSIMPTAQTSFNPAALSSSDQQLVNYAQQAGFKGSELPTALAIIKAESGGNPNAINTANRNGTTDTGLFQINSVHSNWTKGMNLYDPLQNAKAAYKIYTDAGKSWSPWSTYNSGAYVKYLPKNTTTTVPLSNQVASNFAGSIRQIAVDKARSVIGTPYVFGGTNLQSGVDCSGLVQQIYGQLGVALPRTADDQAKSAIGTRTSVANLKPGDLVAWQGGYRGPSYVGHIAIYAGNGQIIEAPDFGLRVRQRALRPNESVFGVHLNFAGG